MYHRPLNQNSDIYHWNNVYHKKLLDGMDSIPICGWSSGMSGWLTVLEGAPFSMLMMQYFNLWKSNAGQLVRKPTADQLVRCPAQTKTNSCTVTGQLVRWPTTTLADQSTTTSWSAYELVSVRDDGWPASVKIKRN